MKKAILFDLDGTLLPMDLDTFTKGYFSLMAKRVAPLGYEPKALVDAIWKGTHAMVKNDGSMTNERRFWEAFTALMGRDVQADIPEFDAFYREDFHGAKALCGENPLAAEAIRAARRNGRRVILATNPLFPRVGVESRLSWIGLSPADFDLVTSYESDSFCKPNPAYYHSILQRMQLAPEDCLMVGNDEREDMHAAALAGIDGYLVTDCLIPYPDAPHTGPRGCFAELVDYLDALN